MSTFDLTSIMTIAQIAQATGISGNEKILIDTFSHNSNVFGTAIAREATDISSDLVFKRKSYGGGASLVSRRANRGSSASYGTIDQHREQIMYIEGVIEVDEFILEKQPDAQAYYDSEIKSQVGEKAYQIAEAFFYGDASSDEQDFNGMATRYSALALDNVHDCSGTGTDVFSAYLVEWDRNSCALIYPRGSANMGVSFKDRGRQRVTDTNAGVYYIQSATFESAFGLAIHDDRSVQRISNLENNGTTHNFKDSTVLDIVSQAKHKLPMKGKGRACLYVPTDSMWQIEAYGLNGSNGFQTYKDIATGMNVTALLGIPVYPEDCLVYAETALT